VVGPGQLDADKPVGGKPPRPTTAHAGRCKQRSVCRFGGNPLSNRPQPAARRAHGRRGDASVRRPGVADQTELGRAAAGGRGEGPVPTSPERRPAGALAYWEPALQSAPISGPRRRGNPLTAFSFVTKPLLNGHCFWVRMPRAMPVGKRNTTGGHTFLDGGPSNSPGTNPARPLEEFVPGQQCPLSATRLASGDEKNFPCTRKGIRYGLLRKPFPRQGPCQEGNLGKRYGETRFGPAGRATATLRNGLTPQGTTTCFYGGFNRMLAPARNSRATTIPVLEN